MIELITFALVSFLQNTSFTIVSRARNSGSYLYHALAAIGSNGIWFITQFFVIGLVAHAVASGDIRLAVGTGIFYTFFTVLGSLFGHWVSKRWIERGSRKVGA